MVMNSTYKMVIIGLNRTQKFNFYLTLDRKLTIVEYLLSQVLNKRLIKFNLIFTKTWVVLLSQVKKLGFKEDDYYIHLLWN